MVLVFRAFGKILEIAKKVLALSSLPTVRALIVGDTKDTVSEQVL
jgi:hypothetical protein